MGFKEEYTFDVVARAVIHLTPYLIVVVSNVAAIGRFYGETGGKPHLENVCILSFSINLDFARLIHLDVDGLCSLVPGGYYDLQTFAIP